MNISVVASSSLHRLVQSGAASRAGSSVPCAWIADALIVSAMISAA